MIGCEKATLARYFSVIDVSHDLMVASIMSV